MGPNQLAIVLGLLTNGLYSLILSAANSIGDFVFREEDIHERLMKSEANFASIIEGAFQDIPPVIKSEEFYEFLKSDEIAEIVIRIYSFGFSNHKSLNNLGKSEDSFYGNLDSLEKVKEDFYDQTTLYFSQEKEVSTIAPQLFSILVECCLKSLDMIIKDEQDLLALDYKIKLYFKISAKRLEENYEKLLRETKANQTLITQVCDNTKKILNELTSLPMRLEPKNNVSDRQLLPHINMAPNLETSFIPRTAEYEKLIQGLLNNKSDRAVAITTALRGAGGYGKTTLAKAICHDPKIQEKFSDGILWVTLGENPKNLIGHVQDLIYRLSDKRPVFEGLEAAVSYFRDLLHEKRLLLVIDDVWNSSHLEPFLQGGSGCVRLITTRINDVLPEGTLEVGVDAMKNEEAAKLLISGLTCTLSWTEDQQINKLANRLGYWPLLLKMVNSALRQHVEKGKSFEEGLAHVNHKLDKKSLTAFDTKNPQKRNQAVEVTICVSFDLLDEDEFERYEELAIFPEDEEIHLKTVEKLWRKTAGYDELDVENLCYKLFNLSLLQTYDENKNVIKLHDVMRYYLYNKQQQTIHFIHAQFLEAYEVKTWGDLPEKETYLWKNLAYHLIGAGKKAELRNLLLNFKWIQSKLNFTDVHLLLNDYDFFNEDYPVEMVKGAIQLSANALVKDKKLLEGQLLGRLELFSDIEIKLILGYIRAHKSGIRILPVTGSLTSPGGPLIYTLIGHSKRVLAVSVTSDGDRAVSASEDNTLKVWDLKTGTENHTLIGHSFWVDSVSITPDGNYAVSISADKALKVWDLNTGKEVHTLIGHSDHIYAVSITPDGNYAVSASQDKTLKVWDLKTGKEVRTLTGHSSWVKDVFVTPNGNNVVSASNDGTLKVWDIKTGKEVRTLTGHSEGIRAVSITPDGNYAVSASWCNRELKAWDLKTGTEIHTLVDYSFWVSVVSITPDGNYAVSDSWDGTLNVWDLKTGKKIYTLMGHSDKVKAISVTPDGSYAVSGSSDKTLKVWDLKTGKEVHTLTGHSGNVEAISIASDGKRVVSASEDRTLKVWNIKNKEEAHTLAGHSDDVEAISVTSDGNYAVSASWDKTLKVWDLKTGKEVHTLIGHSDRVNAVSVTPDGKYAVSASYDNTLKVWDLNTGNEVRTLEGHSGMVRDVCITPDGNYAASASWDNTLKVWDLKTGKGVHTLIGHSEGVNAVSVTPDGNFAVSASQDSTLKVWDLKTGKGVHTLIHYNRGIHTLLHDDPIGIYAVSITPDGNYAVSASWDNTLKVWDLKTGKEVHTLIGHYSFWVRAVPFTPDGKYTISGSSGSTLKVWDLKTGKEVHTLIGHSGGIRAVSVSPDGNYAASTSWDRTLKVWDLKTGREISAFAGDGPFNSTVFSPDSTIIVAGEQSGRVHFLRFETETEN